MRGLKPPPPSGSSSSAACKARTPVPFKSLDYSEIRSCLEVPSCSGFEIWSWEWRRLAAGTPPVQPARRPALLPVLAGHDTRGICGKGNSDGGGAHGFEGGGEVDGECLLGFGGELGV